MMAVYRIVYLTVLGAASVFSLAYGEWLSGVLLAAVLGLPWLSLLFSLPAIFRFRAGISCTGDIPLGAEETLWVLGYCQLPCPPFDARIRIRSALTGKEFRCRSGKNLPTDHCDTFTITLEKIRICDYLGLFSFRGKQMEPRYIRILPKTIPFPVPDPEGFIPKSWQPRPGGGFSEHQELRLYRPGDKLNQVHWKLSAKTGQLISRQSMEPRRGLCLVTVDHLGSRQQLDENLGKLQYAGSLLLQRRLSFRLLALTGEGVLTFSVSTQQEWNRALNRLLKSPPAKSGTVRYRCPGASWHCHIGEEVHAI